MSRRRGKVDQRRMFVTERGEGDFVTVGLNETAGSIKGFLQSAFERQGPYRYGDD